MSVTTSTPMTVYVKTLAGALLAINVEEEMPPCEFPFRVYPLLEEPRPPMAFLRFLKADEGKADADEDEDKDKDEKKTTMERTIHSFPLRFEDGDMFYLLVEDPEVTVRFEWRDMAILNETGETMNYLVMTVEDEQGVELMTEAFYIVYIREITYDPESDEHYHNVRYTDVVYSEDQLLLVFNQANRIRNETGRDWRNAILQPDATAHSSPVFLAKRYFRPDWVPYLSDNIREAWREYLLETTGQTMEEDEDEDQPHEDEDQPEEDYDY